MRNHRLLLVTVLSLVAACAGRGGGPAAPRTPAPPPTPAEVANQARAVLESWRQAYEVRSLEALEPLYLTTPDLVVVGQGRVVHGWEAARERIGAFLGAMSKVRVEVSDVRVMALGDGGAVVNASARRTYGDEVSTVDETGELTLVLIRLDDGWKIAAEHYSFAPATE